MFVVISLLLDGYCKRLYKNRFVYVSLFLAYILSLSVRIQIVQEQQQQQQQQWSIKIKADKAGNLC
jgi:hypothetical protein